MTPPNADDRLFMLLSDPASAAAVPASGVPALICRLAALQAALAARLAWTEPPHPADPHDALLTVDQAAERLAVSKDWLYRRSRRLPFVVRNGRHVRFSACGMDRYIRQREGR